MFGGLIVTLYRSRSVPAGTFVFRRGKFASSLNVSGRGPVSNDQALALAKRVDDRLQHTE
jgi:hypothetical protein